MVVSTTISETTRYAEGGGSLHNPQDEDLNDDLGDHQDEEGSDGHLEGDARAVGQLRAHARDVAAALRHWRQQGERERAAVKKSARPMLEPKWLRKKTQGWPRSAACV